MRIHKEGNITILLTTIALLILVVSFNFLLPVFVWYHAIFYLICFVFWLFIVRFFRHPSRYEDRNVNHVLCPCDGKVVVIEEVYEPEYFNDKRLQVSIFMSPLNVHVNWYPIGGRIKYSEYHNGKYLVAFHPKSSTENERTSVVVENEKASILMRQIAGAVARRVICYAEVDDEVEQGDQLGFIKFGSRIDLFLPLNSKIQVQLNQKVVGKQTVIAHLS